MKLKKRWFQRFKLRLVTFLNLKALLGAFFMLGETYRALSQIVLYQNCFDLLTFQSVPILL
jgi:hypothetical protein